MWADRQRDRRFEGASAKDARKRKIERELSAMN